ncbi:lipoprotein-anchoring transpeptidase ErfK/SrfK [Actinomycetospora succinea]|uniref:Lipoprotein-anchoring transpeptidase ErfK/SrfK n=1 Tax=Actinomycetospora succinea TaxID=663603 RepID=A0A4R6VQ05_9PSEU|nr:L,D-transpeptidase [Actinomycetospora succinea]TDQ65421.1 lipoprotein-anchoring transpeptidase ErfK/SrfK [Actinomycetospora succinea]
MSSTPAGRGRHRLVVARSALRRYPGRAAAALGALAVTAGTALAVPAIAAPATAQNVEESPAARAAHAEALVPGTPCSASARACVDLESQRAWLIRDGKVTRGPMTIASGGEGRATPVGHSLRVYRKEADHVSGESKTRDGRPAPMPFSVFFADGGIAFHSGDPSRSSAGCIRMETDDARATFDDLQVGDKVQVVNASEEQVARGGATR